MNHRVANAAYDLLIPVDPKGGRGGEVRGASKKVFLKFSCPKGVSRHIMEIPGNF